MTQQITLSLSDNLYERLKRWASWHKVPLDKAAAVYLNQTLPDIDDIIVAPAEKDPAVEREKIAYYRLYPQLKENYSGHYVAIYEEKLVDSDTDYGALLKRINAAYGERFVWLTRVSKEPERTINMRSPRFANSKNGYAVSSSKQE